MQCFSYLLKTPVHHPFRDILLANLVGEAKVSAERREDVAVQLAVLGQLLRVVVEQLHVFGVEVLELSVGLDAVRVDRLGDDGDSASD